MCASVYVCVRLCVCMCVSSLVCVRMFVCVCGWEEGGRKSFRDCDRLVSASSSTRLP